MPIAIGFLEYTSIGSGIKAADLIIKNSDITIIMANPNCPGKYQILFTGEVASVTSAVELAEQEADGGYLDSMMLPRVDEKVIQALYSPAPGKVEDSVGIIETLTITDSIIAADTMVKTAQVEILELRLGKGLAGKSYAMVTGTIQNVKEAVETAASAIKDKGILVSKVVISGIAPELLEFLC